ncbi:MAG: rRNA pseudouridine synthase [Lachnospiraceae bacterium]|nr:rRNA pseudouridine synthase [Lachnospiraceae bacterium]
MRLDKYLADMCVGSRSQVKQLIRKGSVFINGNKATDPGMAVGDADTVVCDGVTISHRDHFYYMLNKPAGIITATEDNRQQTVLDLFPENMRKRLFPVGRLDKDTVGLLIITDDGALCHELMAPSHHVDKRYLLHTDAPMTEEDVSAFREGLVLNDGTAFKEAELDIDPDDPCSAVITISEGKYHQIKRMLSARGKEVIYLKRLSVGELELDESLGEGEYRELTEQELIILHKKKSNRL